MKKLDQIISKEKLKRTDDEMAKNLGYIIKDGYGWAGGPFMGLGECATKYALYHWYNEQNLAVAKQWFYVAAKCIAISATKPVGNEKFWALHPFMFPLLSDNLEMIKVYSTIETPNLLERRNDLKNNEFDISLVQTALQGDDTKLASMINTYKAKNYKNQSKFKIAVIQFMEGLLTSDIAEMEAAIALLSKWQLSNPTTEDFLSDYAVVLCKLAWIRGCEVQVDSPLVPMAFMPIASLPHYDDVYEFLKPDWVAPPAPSTEEQEEINRKKHEEAKKANLELVKKLNENKKTTSFLGRLFGK